MSDGWLDPRKYEHVPILGATGPGTMFDGYAWKWVNHSTEGPPGSIAGTIALFQAKPSYCPHFMIDPLGTRRRIQHIPWTWSSCALRGGANGWQTNRGRAVQVEICGFARDSGSWPDDALRQIADLIADVIRDGCPINPTNTPDSSRLRGTLATMDAPQRMGWEQWRSFDGIAAHVYVPNNDHWDIGAANNIRIGQLVQEILGGAPGPAFVPSSGSTPVSDVQVGYLQKGMSGGIVTEIQELLAGLGYDVGPIDGDFGDHTEQAVLAFQRDQSITVDGVVGPETKAKLSAAYAAVSGKPPLPAPSGSAPAWPGRFFVLTDPLMQGEDIRTWQAQMANRGWHLDVDGFYGPDSYGVAKTFQAEKGLTCDGFVGPETWAAAWTAPVT